jgi:hypothetical protein
VAEPSTAPSTWFEWRYAVAGLGWGVAVGAATGALVGIAAGVGVALDEGVRAVLVLIPLLGVVLGAVPGAAAGSAAGLVNAVGTVRVVGERAARRVAFVLTLVTGTLTATSLALWWQVRDVEVAVAPGAPDLAATALWTLPPVLVGAWLMARTVPAVRRKRDRLMRLDVAVRVRLGA